MGSQDLQTARYDQLVRRVGGLYGGGAKVTEVLPEMFPVLELENTTPELLTLSGWRTAWQHIQQDSVPAITSMVELSNPVGSTLLAVVTQVLIRTDINADCQLAVSDTLLTTPIFKGLFRDARLGPGRATGLNLRRDTAVASAAGLRITTDAGSNVVLSDVNGLAVLTPGTSFRVGTVTNQVILDVNFVWRERIALESEINFP